MTLVQLYDLTQQFNNKNGAILVGGKLYVYYVGRTELATTWADEDGAAQNTNPVLLDNNGRAPVFVDDSYSYTLVVCDRAGTELFSQDITPGGAGSVGGRIVYHDETLSGNGTVSSLLGVINIPLGVDETMTAYTGVAEGKDALILGVNSDWFNDTFGSAFDQKVDLETFSACCSGVKGGLGNKLDASAINNYYTKNEVDGRTSSFVNYNFLSGNYYSKNETSSREELYSAFLNAGQGGGGSCPWISGGKEIAEAQTLTSNMLFQALSSFTLSGDHNHFISIKGGIYRFPNEWELASGIAITNYFMPQSSFSSYSATIAGDISTLYGQDGYLNGQIGTLSGVLKSTSSTVNSNSGNWGKSYTACTANSGNWTSVYNTVHGNSGIWNNKLDASAFTAYTAQADESYILIPGNGIDISSNTAQATTTIWFTGTDGALSAGEGIAITSANGKQVITNNISAGDNISLVYDSTNNKIRIDCDITGDVGHTYTGVAPIQVNNTTDQISISGEGLSAGPGIDMFASGGYVVISANDQSNCHCIKFTNTLTSVNLENYSAYDKVTVVNARQYGSNCELHWDGNTKVFPSGLYCELVRGTKNDNSDKWSFTTSGWTNDNWWDYN